MENVIKIFLTSTGIGDAVLEKNISLYVGSYQNKLLSVYVPKSFLYENEEKTFNYAVSVSALMTSDSGKKVTSKPYYLSYLKEVSLLDPQTQEMTDYVVLERVLPKEFTVYVGTTTVIVNVINLDNTDNTTMLDIITSQTCYLQVQESEYADEEEEVETSEFEKIVSRVTRLEQDIDKIDNVVSLGENFVTHLIGEELPDAETLDKAVYDFENKRMPRNGDVITFTLKMENETDKSYKYIYGAYGWEYWQIPAVENASNGSLGLVEGTYSTNDEEVTTTEVNIRNGKILNVYVNVEDRKEELVDYLNTGLPKKYQTIEAGASKQYVKDYSLPREFNDTYYIGKDGYSTTLPSGDVQFTETSISIEDLTLFDIEFQQDAEFQLSSKNSCTNNIYISANQNIDCYFRLTTYAKERDIWQLLSIELTDIMTFTRDNIRKVIINSTFGELNGVLNITNNSSIRQVLEVIPQSGLQTTFNVYSNSTFPSLFNLNTHSLVLITHAGKLGEQPSIEIEGVLNDHSVIFEIPESINLTNNVECELKLIIPQETINSDVLLINYNGQLIRLVTPYNITGNATLDMISQVNKKLTSNSYIYTMKVFVKIDDGDNIEFIVDEDDLTKILDDFNAIEFAESERLKTINLFSSPLEQGSVASADGTLTSNDTRVRTANYISLKAGTYTISNKNKYLIPIVYDTNRNHIPYELADGWITSTTFTFTITNDRLIKFVFRNTDNSNILPTDVSEIMLVEGSFAQPYQEYNGQILHQVGGIMTGALKIEGITNKEKAISVESPNSDAMVSFKRTDVGNEIAFGIGGNGTARGIWDEALQKWLIMHDNSGLKLNGSGTRPKYNSKDLALYSDVPAEILYDCTSSSSSINWGKTAGIQAGVKVSGKDFSKYSFLRVTVTSYDTRMTYYVDLKKQVSNIEATGYPYVASTQGSHMGNFLEQCVSMSGVNTNKNEFYYMLAGYINGSTWNERKNSASYIVTKIEGVI